MSLNRRDWFSLILLPGRLTTGEMEMTIGLPPGSAPILIRVGLLRPLGRPPANGHKYFSRDYVLALCKDEKWLARASDALVKHWAKRNSNVGNASQKSSTEKDEVI